MSVTHQVIKDIDRLDFDTLYTKIIQIIIRFCQLTHS